MNFLIKFWSLDNRNTPKK